MTPNTKSEGAEWEREFDEMPFGITIPFNQEMMWGEVEGFQADGREELKAYFRNLIAHQRQQAELAANLRAVEILHKHAMTTKDTHALDLIEAAQKEILASGGESDLAAVRQQAVAEFAQEVEKLRQDVPVDYVNTHWTPDEIRHGESYNAALDDIHTLLKERGIEL